MKNKKLEERIEKYCESTKYPFQVYFSDIVSDARYKGYKYFFKYFSTNKVAIAFKTQREIEDFLDNK